MLLRKVMEYVVKRGRLTVNEPGGRTWTVGDGNGPSVTVTFHDRAAMREIALNPQLKLGETYMDGRMTVEDGGAWELLDVLGLNVGTGYGTPLARAYADLRLLFRRAQQYNPVGKAQKNVAHHYDLDGGIYDLFLDTDRQYSCAYFERPDATLEEAQLAKKRHIAAKLALKPGQRVLDIGSGWGGLGLYLAKVAESQVTGVTLSTEQHTLSNARAEAQHLSNQAEFLLKDYRHLDTKFDRIVSVGMFEHVGVGHYREYFNQVARLLEDDGVALIHTIGRIDGPGTTNQWIAKYIFPGGYIPALSEMMQPIERAGLYVTDVEVLRIHYADTLRHWRERFVANWDRAAEIYDERFCRMWEFYLAASEASFRHMGMVVFQVQVSKQVDTLPLTRGYIEEAERTLAEREKSADASAAGRMRA